MNEEIINQEVEQVEEVEEQEEEVVLPSDIPTFEMPEKFKGKSAEEIAKSYVELEKLYSRKIENKSTTEPAPLSQEQYSKFETKFRETGSLSEEDYAELEKLGYSREVVDTEIAYRQYQEEKNILDVLAPLGGGLEKLNQVASWAKETKSEEEVKNINEALKSTNKQGQQAILKMLYNEYENRNTSQEPIHTNSPQVPRTRGYNNEADFFKDLSDPRYKSGDKYFIKAVEQKLSLTDTSNWSI